MFDIVLNDISSVLPETFIAYKRERKALSNKSTKVFYDEVSSIELTLLALQRDNKDLSVGDIIYFDNEAYKIYQINVESRFLLRLFLKKEHYAS